MPSCGPFCPVLGLYTQLCPTHKLFAAKDGCAAPDETTQAGREEREMEGEREGGQKQGGKGEREGECMGQRRIGKGKGEGQGVRHVKLIEHRRSNGKHNASLTMILFLSRFANPPGCSGKPGTSLPARWSVPRLMFLRVPVSISPDLHLNVSQTSQSCHNAQGIPSTGTHKSTQTL